MVETFHFLAFSLKFKCKCYIDLEELNRSRMQLFNPVSVLAIQKSSSGVIHLDF